MKQKHTLLSGNWLAVLVTVISSGWLASAQTPLVLSGTSYTQNFDAIGGGLPPEWAVYTNATATDPGAMTSFNTNALNWDSPTADFGNCASTTANDGTSFSGNESPDLQAAATNRAPGIRSGDSGAALVLQINNTLGFANFQFTADFLDLGTNGDTNTWTVDYALGDAPTNFIPVANYASPGVFGATTKNISFGQALDDQSQTVWIRIAALTARSDGQPLDTFGVDNFVLNYTIAPALRIQRDGDNVVVSWSDPTKFLQYSDVSFNGTWYYVLDVNSNPVHGSYSRGITGPQLFFRLTSDIPPWSGGS